MPDCSCSRLLPLWGSKDAIWGQRLKAIPLPLAEVFANKLELKILARKMSRGNEIISASLAREYYKAGKWRELSDLVPFTTFLHLRSTAAGKHISIDEQ